MSKLKDWLNADAGKKEYADISEMDLIKQDDSLYGKWADEDEDKDRQLEEQYRASVFRRVIFVVICAVVIIVSAGFIIAQDDGYPLEYLQVYSVLWNHILHGPVDPATSGWQAYFDDYVVWDLRLPRVAIGVVAGFGLAVAGCVMQSTLKNPMADSYTTGVSAGAAFGAALAMLLNVHLFSYDMDLLVLAFVFSLVPTFIIMTMSRTRKMNATSMILTGMAVMYIFGACTTALKLMAEPEALASLYRWQVGSLRNLKWDAFPVMFIVTLIGSTAVMVLSNRINILSSGDESAKTLGINADRLRVVCLITVSLVTASIVSFVGTIGFVGLVAPHIARIFIGNDNRFLIPASAAFGAVLMIISDYLGRVILAPAVLEVGVVTAFLGGPLFLWLIVRQRKEVWA